MESTRERILAILRSQREVTIDALMHALDLAPATVRRHLDILQRDGYVTVRPVRRETGRPHYAFSLTERGEELFPQHYMRITSRLIDAIGALSPAQTAGRSGRELADLALEQVAQGLARSYSAVMEPSALPRRLEQALELLANEGLVFEMRPEGEGYLLLARDCPYKRFTGVEDDACLHDQHLLSLLLDASVERLGDGAAGGCAYFVSNRT